MTDLYAQRYLSGLKALRCYFPRSVTSQKRLLSSKNEPSSSSKRPYRLYTPTSRETWLASYLRSSPRALAIFRITTKLLGVDSTKQLAARRAYTFYKDVCAPRELDETNFWHDQCNLPSTFQSWFTITNLHVWMLTTRFRALPSPQNKFYIQALIDHFFFDTEDRVRSTLSEKVPERLITQQMHVLREQWAGLGLTLDHCLGLSVLGKDADVEMAAAMWRNFLGARGAQGIDDPGSGKTRHRVNLWGKTGMPRLRKDAPEETLKGLEETDDGSGIYDYSGDNTKLYVEYPELIYSLVAYVRRELVRLENVTDEDILSGEGVGHFGPVWFKAQK